MDIGLCMVVKDEAGQIGPCLAPIIDLFDEVAVVDTGSRDGTPDRLRTELGIVAYSASLDIGRCNCLCDARAEGLKHLSTPWVVLLDADERIERSTLTQIRAMRDGGHSAGYFGRWINHVDGLPPFEDYKLFLFRSGLRPVGLVHDVVQHDIRARGLRAEWLECLTVQHFPDETRRGLKTRSYRKRLRCAIVREPEFIRYQWFLGYMDFLGGRFESAISSLGRAVDAQSRDFPVETLNSAMVLADIHARRRDRLRLRQTLDQASAFFASVSHDFEVAVNVRLGPWLAAAHERLQSERIEEIRAYRFAC